ncbi:MAG: hypothetical protein ABI171_16820 [Collimonas sp.]|uniref:hypothetical protein n=1 Tax=Collimonas sp. TaxID=1963772 RepID=UPI003263BA21
MLSPAQIELLLSQRSISERQPWASNDELKIQDFYQTVCASVCRDTASLSRIEWRHYSSGYASFIDAWFYKPERRFGSSGIFRKWSHYKGLIVLLSRLSPHFVFMEGEKHWTTTGGSSYMPESAMLDRLPTPGVAALAAEVQAILESHGLVRAFKDDLSDSLPLDIEVPTILAEPPYTQYDALFYWED